MSALPPLLNAHFLAPRRVGDPSAAPLRGRAQNSACGDHLELGLWPLEGRVERARFRARGCSAVLACASLTLERIEGLTLDRLEKLDVGALLADAGALPATRAHAPRLVARCLAAALAQREPTSTRTRA